MASKSNIVSFKNARMISNMVNELVTTAFADRLGRSWYSETTGLAKRNIYETLGYVKEPRFNDYYSRYKRGDIAKRVISAPSDACWRLLPSVKEYQEKEDGTNPTAFDEAWDALVDKKKVFHYLSRADRISGIGKFGVLLLGFSGSERIHEPITPGENRELLYMMPYMEGSVGVQVWDVDPQSPRYGLPVIYQIRMSNFMKTGTSSVNVHHSRVLHLAEGSDENDVYGTPRAEAVLNRLQDLELIAGGSGEMYWRGALPGFNFEIDPDADIQTIDTDDLKNQIELYIHGLQRFFRTQGMKAQQLAPQVVSPTDHVEIQLTLISATTGIPKRILMGSERGELASTQDENNWFSRMEERRTQYVEPMVLRPFIDKLIEVGALPPVNEYGYEIDWPKLFVPDEKERAETAKIKTEALATYANSQGADMILPVDIFHREIMEFDPDLIEEIMTKVQELEVQEAEQEKEAQAELERQQAAMDRNQGGSNGFD